MLNVVKDSAPVKGNASITDEEKSGLRDLGYPENDILNMKPYDAERILYVQRLYGERFPCLESHAETVATNARRLAAGPPAWREWGKPPKPKKRQTAIEEVTESLLEIAREFNRRGEEFRCISIERYGNEYKLEHGEKGKYVITKGRLPASNVADIGDWRRKLAEHAQQKAGAGTEPQQERVRPISVATLAGQKAPERKWVVEELIPDRNVTNFTGDGGTGKSLFILQLLAAAAMPAQRFLGRAIGRFWAEKRIAIATEGVSSIYFSAEDEFDEVWRRLESICTSMGADVGDLGNLHVLPYMPD
jgi:hypothetical protein